MLCMLIATAAVPFGVSAIGNEDLEANASAVVELALAQRHEEAIPLCQALIDNLRSRNAFGRDIAVWLRVLGSAQLEIGKTAEAEASFLEGLQIVSKPEFVNEPIVRQLMDALSQLYTQTHNYEQAQAFSDKARSLYEQNMDFGEEYVRCLSNAALVRANLGYHEIARILVDVSLRLAKANLANVDATASCPPSLAGTEEARHSWFVATKISPYITILNNASQIYKYLGHDAYAVKTLKAAIGVAEEYGLVDPILYNNLGTLYFSKSKFAKASEWFGKSYALCRTPYEREETGMNRALGLFLSGNEAASDFSSEFSSVLRANIQDMFAFMSASERVVYWSHLEHRLPMLNLIMFQSGKEENFGAVYDNVLEAKGLLLRSANALRDVILSSSNPLDARQYNQIKALRQQLLVESDSKRRKEMNAEIDGLDKSLTRRVSAYKGFSEAAKTTWKEVRDALAEDAMAIEFYNIAELWGTDSIQTIDGAPRICALVLKKHYGNPKIIPLCRESMLEDLDKEDLYSTNDIYNLIWRPLEEELVGIKRIYFAADRMLHQIAVEYVPMPQGGIFSEHYDACRLSSTRVLAENKCGSTNYSAVLYGGLTYDVDLEALVAESRNGDRKQASASRASSGASDRYGVHYLPGTLQEVKEISRNFKSMPKVMTGIKGTEESFKSLAGSDIGILHLATHGFFWNEEDAEKRSYVSFLQNKDKQETEEDKALMRSGLFLSGANLGLRGVALPDDVEDGILTALELSNMIGNVDMVVMSACQSGLGETSAEGVFGLQRGFKLAGARSLMMSLWEVDDEATKHLMTAFYKHYLSGKTKQESLTLAQRALRENPRFSDPRYWAAFILLDGFN